MKHVTLSLALLAALAARTAAAEEEYRPRPKGTLTFARDVAPLIFKNCAACHRPGEVAPFPLLTYADVKKRASQIAKVTAKRLMPPWKPVPGHVEFRDERRLTADQIGMLRQWADEGAPLGNPKDVPPTPKFPEGWQLGKPDLIVTMPKEYTVPADGPDIYRNFVIPFKVPAGKYIRAMEFRPGNRKVVHHAILSYDATNDLRKRDGKDGAPGFTQFNPPGIVLAGNMAFWVPGKDAKPLPDGVAMRWPEGADLVLQLHVHPSGKKEVERSTIGFYLTDTPPKRSLRNFVLQEQKINIPPGKKDYRLTASRTVSEDVELYGIFPHMHLIGKQFLVTAELPGGEKKTLLRIDDWDFNWQGYYEYAKPVPIPKGTKLVMETTHDNSADNPANPNTPPKRVRYGEGTTDEMAIVLIHAIPKNPSGPRDHLAEAKKVIARFDLDKDGKLSSEEMAKLPGIGGNLKAILKRFDRDGDGKLDAAEIAAAMRALRGE